MSADNTHGGSTGLAKDIDTACQGAQLWPDAVLSGHAHLYQRFTRRVADLEIPYLVSGSGGFAVSGPQAGLGSAPVTMEDHTLEIDPVVDYGYLTVTVDLSKDAKTLAIAFHSPNLGRNHDSVVVNLGTRKIIKQPRQGSQGPATR
jgi:hypothetical protein